MKWVRILSVFSLLFTAFVVPNRFVLAQEPKRWISGDTLWLEIDSMAEFVPHHQDTSLFRWTPPLEIGVHQPHHEVMPNEEFRSIKFEYEIPQWSVYRRSIRLWGINFSTGQPSPYAPFPQQNEMDAEVLSFPIPKPR